MLQSPARADGGAGPPVAMAHRLLMTQLMDALCAQVCFLIHHPPAHDQVSPHLADQDPWPSKGNPLPKSTER